MKREFSVSMCVYEKDDPTYFGLAVDSILNQTIPPTEVVLVVDGPVPENLNKVILQYENKDCFRVIRLPENLGHGEARKVGLAACQYDFVAIMDADDLSVPERFEWQLAAFEANEDLSIVGGNIAEFIGDVTNVVGKRIVPSDDAAIKEYMKLRCPMNLVTVMFKKEQVDKVGGFIDWYCEEDYYLWLRMALANMKFGNVSKILVNVRVGKEMYRRRGGWRYYKSEAKLQKFMRKNKIIGCGTYVVNCSKRFIVQVLLPNRVRGWVFKKFARTE